MKPYRIKTIIEYHRALSLPKPAHPLISVINIKPARKLPENTPASLIADFYFISLKKDFKVKVRYGQQKYDFNEGVMSFMSPNQVYGLDLDHDTEIATSGWMLVIHPDFLWNTPMAKKIKQYEFFDYSVNEALFLSDKEETAITQIVRNIEREYNSATDKFSHNIIISQLDSLLNYSERFYQRQFLTRRKSSNNVLNKFEGLLSSMFDDADTIAKGLPSVSYIAEKLNVSPDYLSSLLKTLTGLNTQQHIHQKLIEKAKEKLSTTDLTVSEIAYQLGFEHSQSFSKLFKIKTKLSPLEFRQSFN